MKIIRTERIPIKIWSNEIDDLALAQAKNLANLPYAFKWIAIMPDVHPGYGMPIGGILATTKIVVPNAVGVDIGCFSGETKISLLDGTQKTLRELTLRRVPFWVYSMNKDLKVVPGRAVALKTRKKASLVRVTISGGEEIVCTPDHQFMLNDGSYREAKNLKPYDSLMPLYRTYQTRDGYERLLTRTGKSISTHIMVGEYIFGEKPSGCVFHHVDECQWDNRPENLQVMSALEHNKLPHSRKVNHLKSSEFKSARIQTLKIKGFYGKRYAQKKKDVALNNIMLFMNEHPNEFAMAVAGNGRRGKKYLVAYNQSEKGRAKSREISNRMYACEICGSEVKSPIGLYNHRITEHHNHKVINVTELKHKEDVYCLRVERYHNFALSAGVFVHNCGMEAVRTSVKEVETENLKKILGEIRKAIPVGFSHHQEPQDWVGFTEAPDIGVFREELASAKRQIGTLGGGNHFIEILKGDDGAIWLMVHSGSRNVGFKTANFYHKLALKYCANMPDLPDKDLSFLMLDSAEGKEYLAAMNFCLQFAQASRDLMMAWMKEIFAKYTKATFSAPINVHHNFAAVERHFDEEVVVHRKGATKATKGLLGIIPGSMGTPSYIVEGLGNSESFCSCAHGAGRRLGRKEAIRSLNLAEEQAKMPGVFGAPRTRNELQEAPGAYKDIDQVLRDQKDLVKIKAKLTPLAVVTGN